MSCQRIWSLLSPYHDNELDHEQHLMVEIHLLGCTECRALLEDYRRQDRLIASLPPLVPPERIRQQILATYRPEKRLGLPSPFSQLAQGIAQGGLILLVIASSVWLFGQFSAQHNSGRGFNPLGVLPLHSGPPSPTATRVVPTPSAQGNSSATPAPPLDTTPVAPATVLPATPVTKPATSPALIPEGYFVYAKNSNLWSIAADGSNLRQLTHLSGNYGAVPFIWTLDPAQDRVAFVDPATSALWVINSDGSNLRKASAALLPPGTSLNLSNLLLNGGLKNSIIWSPDGSHLAFPAATDAFTSDLFVYSVNTAASLSVTHVNGTASLWPVWAASGNHLAFERILVAKTLGTTTSPSTICIVSNDVTIQVVTKPGVLSNGDRFGTVGHLAWLDDDTFTLSGLEPGTLNGSPLNGLWRVRVSTGSVTRLAAGPLALADYSVADREWLFSSLDKNEVATGISIVSAESGNVRTLLVEHHPILAQWSPSGAYFYYLDPSTGAGTGDLHIVTPTNSQDYVLARQVTASYPPVWSRRSSMLVYVKVNGPVIATFVRGSGFDGTFTLVSGGFVPLPTSWSPDGKTILLRSTSGNGQILAATRDGLNLRKLDYSEAVVGWLE